MTNCSPHPIFTHAIYPEKHRLPVLSLTSSRQCCCLFLFVCFLLLLLSLLFFVYTIATLIIQSLFLDFMISFSGTYFSTDGS